MIGIGRLGICLALNLERCGYKILGIDKNKQIVDAVNKKTYATSEPFVVELLKSSQNFTASNNLEEIFEQNYSIVFIVVPTPSLSDGAFDHSAINDVIIQLKKFKKNKQALIHLIINSTTTPGYCDALQATLDPNEFLVTYNPEFIAQGSIIQDQRTPDQVLIGEANKLGGDLLLDIYRKMCTNQPVISRMSRISAEITKLATNCFLTTKIAFANAIGDIAMLCGGEQDKILNAIGADSRIGNNYFKYGFGYGGPCFPRDNKAFIHFANKLNYKMQISESTDKANEAHAQFMFETYQKENKNDGLIVFESITYKKNTDIIEESQQLKLALDLAKGGKKVKIIESASVINQLNVLYGNLFEYQVNES